ncbi:peptidoglycan bridge formation glycyltransferase FemA/FemB family protein [Candidatus Dojkabacteria bacterium]|uniref:Peptidoglycan bridge formation glycyltransferase FemA/FemB family protein n=1 Tax=Candidatus Dojkabacteria bacterium TaxID=2099670 RepID=A0A3M0Z5W1_9BACT|nr:MAG: peptidoglycan bridge formation glycyltransferase FemA/FemB family protein [Candidatus Dojkabacteria bacterium]
MHFQQTEKWFKAKASKSVDFVFLCKEGIFVQLNKIPLTFYKYAYIPRVDVTKLDLDGLKKILRKKRCIAFQVDPINEYEDGLNTSFIKFRRVPPVALQYNVIIDVSKPLDEILKTFKPKHRYNLKIAERSGLEFRFSTNMDDLSKFVKLYQDTAKRHSYIPRTPEYINSVWSNFSGCAFIASVMFKDEILSSWFIIQNEDTFYYLYGGSVEKYKSKMPSYFLLWNIIKEAKSRGVKYIDLMGIKDPRIYASKDGFTRFKLGWTNGKYIKYLDSFEVVINPIIFWPFNLVRKVRDRFSFLKKLF